ncbi:MAG: hypothetical protein LVS60_10090 [Nodosilinea sp. LVE1205-7]
MPSVPLVGKTSNMVCSHYCNQFKSNPANLFAITMAIRERLRNYLDTTDSLGGGFVTVRLPA